MYYQTPIKKNEWNQYDREILEIFEDGRVVCSCINGLWKRGREHCSECRHVYEFISSLREGNLEDYIFIEQ